MRKLATGDYKVAMILSLQCRTAQLQASFSLASPRATRGPYGAHVQVKQWKGEGNTTPRGTKYSKCLFRSDTSRYPEDPDDQEIPCVAYFRGLDAK